MDINVGLLKQICEESGTSGFEKRIRDLIIKEVSPLVDKVEVDHIGNVTAIKKGKQSKKVMLAAHMDEIGFIVSHIDDKGFIKFKPLGGFDPKTLTSMRVWVHGKEDIKGVMGGKPIHLMSAEERGKKLKLSDYFIDTGLPGEKVKELVTIGDPITRRGNLEELGETVVAKSLDNRVSVFILIEVLRAVKDTEVPYDIYAVFTTQEEVGCRGARVAALNINPDFGINLDTTIAFDTPDAKPDEMITKLGGGTAIKIMDSSVICDYRMVAFMKQMTAKHNIEWQAELMIGGGTDSSQLQQMAMDGGAIVGGVSIPTRNIHQTIEMCNKGDIQKSIELTKVCLQELDTYDWAH